MYWYDEENLMLITTGAERVKPDPITDNRQVLFEPVPAV